MEKCPDLAKAIKLESDCERGETSMLPTALSSELRPPPYCCSGHNPKAVTQARQYCAPLAKTTQTINIFIHLLLGFVGLYRMSSDGVCLSKFFPSEPRQAQSVPDEHPGTCTYTASKLSFQTPSGSVVHVHVC